LNSRCHANARGTTVLSFVLLLLSFGGGGCCTRELAVTLGNAARESFFREQDRMQQRFMQIEADAVKETISTVRDVISDPKTRGAVKQIADDLTRSANKNLEASSAALERTIKRIDATIAASTVRLDKQLHSTFQDLSKLTEAEQLRLRKSLLTTADEVSVKANETFKKVIRTAVDDTREVFREQAVLDDKSREEFRKSVQPVINDVIEESSRRAREAVQENIDNLSLPVLAGSGALLAVALLTMVLPSLFLFMSYRRSVAALQTLAEVLAEQQRFAAAEKAPSPESEGSA